MLVQFFFHEFLLRRSTAMLKNLTLVLLALVACTAFVQGQYLMRLQNDAIVDNGGAYEFDVVMASTSGTVTLTSYQLLFTYNTAVAKGGTPLTFSYVGGSSAIGITPTAMVTILDDNGSNLAAGSTPGSDVITTTPVRLGRFRLASAVGFTSGQQANVVWDFGGGLVTEVNLSNTLSTVPGNHTSTLGNSALPITLASFTATPVTGGGTSVLLTWKTVSEIDNLGFDVERALVAEGPYALIAGSFREGHGTTIEPQTYSYTDANSEGKGWYYRLKQTDRSGAVHYTDPIQANVTSSVAEDLHVKPVVYALEQNYPNPFNPTTVVSSQLPAASNVRLVVYDLLGREVAVLVNEQRPAGYYKDSFDASSLASGIYIYRLTAGSFVETRRMVLVK
jgi:hypothetical protein